MLAPSYLTQTHTSSDFLCIHCKLGCVLFLCMFMNCICVYDTFTPSVLMRRAVRTRAKRVALNITVPSLLRGMFMDTSRCRCTDKVSQVMCPTHCRIGTFCVFVPCMPLYVDKAFQIQGEAESCAVTSPHPGVLSDPCNHIKLRSQFQ